MRCKTYRGQWFVDLKPGQRQKEYIVGNEISESPIGHVLLDAYYRLKQRYNELLDPDTEEGFLFWGNVQRIAQGENVHIPARIWIEPGNTWIAIAHDGSVYLEKVDLNVFFEEYRKDNGYGVVIRSINDHLEKQVIWYMQKNIIPILEKKVNESPEFAPLRTAYSPAALAETCLWNNTIKEFARLMPLNTIDNGYIHELQTKYESIYSAYEKRFGSYTVIYEGVDFTKPLATTVHRLDLNTGICI